MEMLNKNQIEQFLHIEREVVQSADHVDVANRDRLWWIGDQETISGLTITTSMTTTRPGVN